MSREVRALVLVYGDLQNTAKNADVLLGVTTVRVIDDTDNSVDVSVARPDGSAGYVFDGRSDTLRRGTVAGTGENVTLGGLALKALAVTYAAWFSNEIAMPYTPALKAGAYTVAIWQGTSGRDGAPGFIISVAPIAQPDTSSGGIVCADYRNYFVVTGTWQILREPKIC